MVGTLLAKMNIEEQISQVNFKDPEQVVNFYESNRIYFYNYERLKDPEKISEFINIKLHYANSLTDKHHLDKVLSILIEVSQLLEKLPSNHWNYEKSERHVRFLQGMALARQKKYKKSYIMFKRLVKEDPEHFYYKVWCDHAKLGTYNWIFNGVSILGLLLIFGDIIFSLSDKASFDVGIVGFVTIGLTFLAKKVLNEYFKRKKTALK
jgi:hypothetical protein